MQHEKLSQQLLLGHFFAFFIENFSQLGYNLRTV